MEELTKTNDINTLTTEILILKQQTAQNIIEIGRRLIKVKKELNHGEWLKWLQEEVEFKKSTANNFMRVASEFSNVQTLGNLNQSKIFALLDLPSEEREEFISESHDINGETKTIDEMSTRELQQAIKAKKEAEKKAQELELHNKELENQLHIAQNKEPKIIEKVVEIDNTDYSSIEKLKSELEYKEKMYNILKDKEQIYKEQLNLYEQDSQQYKDLKRQIELLTKEKDDIGRAVASATELSGYIFEIESLLKDKLAPIKYSRSLIDMQHNSTVIKNVEEIVQCVENWCIEIRQLLPKNYQNIINVNMEDIQ